VVTDQERQVVYVVGTDGVARMRPVELGPIARGLRVVRAGLAAGDEVVIDGVQRAQAGEKVAARRGRIAFAAPAVQPSSALAPPPSSAEPVGAGR